MAALKHAYQVAILTHEATEIPFEETIADELTQFFVSAGVSLHTTILVDDLEYAMGQKRNAEGKKWDHLILVNYAGYLKECVESAEQLKGQDAEVVIALCHGSERQLGLPASLCFRCHNKPPIASFMDSVYAKEIDDAKSPSPSPPPPPLSLYI